MLRQDAERFMLGKYLSDKKIPWQRRRRLGVAVAKNYANSQFSDQNRQDAISRHLYDSMQRHLYDSMHAAQKPKNKLKFITIDKESKMSTLWRRET